MEIIGQTIDDAAGEAFDKCAKVLGLPYPGGPWIDKLAKLGDATKYPFAKPNIPNYDYSFSGLKTSFLYTLRDMLKAQGVETIDELAERVPNLREDMCASLQATVVDIPCPMAHPQQIIFELSSSSQIQINGTNYSTA